jgi:peptidoglycan/xylan/chitin deacetylase (PgdA/CDA1 family)
MAAVRESWLRVLAYHRLEDPRAPRLDLAPDLVSADPALFAQHADHLARFYHPVAADEVLAALSGRHVLPRRAVLVTFDDAYKDFRELAYPMLEVRHVPVVLFVPTAFVDAPHRIFWWDALWQALARTRAQEVQFDAAPWCPLRSWDDRVAAARVLAEWLKTRSPSARAAACTALQQQLGVEPEPTDAVLSWAELRQLAAAGVTVAAHSRTHELLDQLSGADLAQEVDGCRRDLVQALGSCPPLFAYPNGNVNGLVARALDAAGFQAGFTAIHGINRLSRADARALRRDQATRLSPLWFGIRLMGPVISVRTRRHRVPTLI